MLKLFVKECFVKLIESEGLRKNFLPFLFTMFLKMQML